MTMQITTNMIKMAFAEMKKKREKDIIIVKDTCFTLMMKQVN